MSNLTAKEVIQAWRDPNFRTTLSEGKLAAFQGMSEAEIHEIMTGPAGAVELTDEELESVAGGYAAFGSCNQNSC